MESTHDDGCWHQRKAFFNASSFMQGGAKSCFVECHIGVECHFSLAVGGVAAVSSASGYLAKLADNNPSCPGRKQMGAQRMPVVVLNLISLMWLWLL